MSTVTGDVRTTDAPPTSLPPFAKLQVLAIAGATSLLLLLTSGRGGYFADEIYFIGAGNRPSFGYADQPPLVPLLARLLDDIYPDSLVWLRLPMTLLTGVGVVLCALIARELGGERRAQWLAAAAYALSPVFLGFGRVLGTYSIDPVLWTLAFWLLVRWIRMWSRGARADWLLLLFGLVVAVDVQVKYLIGGMLVVLFCSLLVFGPRRLLTRPALWVGAVFTVVTMLPGVLWQANHDWPQLAMSRVLSSGSWLILQPVWLVPAVVVGAGLPGAFLLCVGVWRLVSAPGLRPYRCLGWTAIGTTALFVATGGAFYYVSGLVPLCVAAGAATLQEYRPRRWWRWATSVPACAVAAALAVVSTVAAPAPALGPTGGWSRLAAGTARVYDGLPAATRDRTVVMGHMYYQAAALEKFGQRHGLPDTAYSANRGYWYFGAPPAGTERVVYVGGNERELRRHFGEVRRMSTVAGNPTGVVGQNKNVPVWLCTDPADPWPRLWRQMQRTF